MKKLIAITLFILLAVNQLSAPIVFAETVTRQFPVSPYKVGGYDFKGPVSYSDGSFWHLGEDASAKAGTQVMAPSDGKVMFSKYAGSFGYVVILEHADGYCSIFGHLAKNNRTTLGVTVKRGDNIGVIGTKAENGNWPEHLHWGIHSGSFGANQGQWPSWAMGRSSAGNSIPSGWMDPTDWVNAAVNRLTENVSVNSAIQTAGETVEYVFIPTATGKYEIRTNGDTDTYGTLLDSTYKILKENDDTYGTNFCLVSDLQGGQTYRIRVRNYYRDRTGNFSICVCLQPSNVPLPTVTPALPPQTPTPTTTPVAPVQPQPASSDNLRLDIRMARYGSSGNAVDITQNVRAFIQQDERIDIQVANALCDYDPVPNVSKQLVVTYRNRWNEEYRLTIQEGSACT